MLFSLGAAENITTDETILNDDHGGIYYQAEGEGHLYELTKESGAAENENFGESNYLSLSAEAFKIDAPHDYENPNEFTTVWFSMSATGYSEFYKFNDLSGGHLWQQPAELQLEAEATLSDSEHEATISFHEYSEGVNVGGDEEPEEPEDDVPMENTLETTIETIVDETPAGASLTFLEYYDAITDDFSDRKFNPENLIDSGSEPLIR